MKGHCVHVRLCRQCPGADVADVRVAAGHAAAPCGNGARSTSRLRTRLRCAAGAAPPSTALRVRSAAIQRRAEAGAAGACRAFPLRQPGRPVAGGLFNMQPMWPVGAPHCEPRLRRHKWCWCGPLKQNFEKRAKRPLGNGHVVAFAKF